MFAAKEDYREVNNDWITKTYDEHEVKAIFSRADSKDFYLDDYMTTYNNKLSMQTDWLITGIIK